MSEVPTPAELREVAGRVAALAVAVRAVRDRFRAAADGPTRRIGGRLDNTAGELERVVRELETTAGILTRVRARGTCAADWGLCPEHGDTLIATGNQAWCRAAGCDLRWGYDRAGLPCDQPAAYVLTDPGGPDVALCAGHARLAREQIAGPVVLTPM